MSLDLGPGEEFDRIRAIIAGLGSAAGVLGDDCALIPVGDTILAASVDISVEGVHFRTDWLTFPEIGWRSTAAALSDLAAEGAKPIGVLVSLGLPDHGQRKTENAEDAAGIMTGVGAAVQHVGGKVLGGDLVRSDKYLVDVCVLGVAERPVRRSGARPGDGVWVTGTLGGAAVALREWLAGRRPEGDLATRYARPEPRIAAGRWLATQGATAMIDVSDGLSGDAGHLAAASGVQIEIALERVPCWVGVEPLLAVASGEEFELLVTLPPAFGEAEARAFTNANHLPLTRIGRCAAGVPSVRFADRGVPVSAPHGFDHFAR